MVYTVDQRMSSPSPFIKMFRDLIGHKVILELKNEVVMKGTLKSCDVYFNFELIDVEVLNHAAFPQLPIIDSTTVRGSAVHYVYLPPDEIDLAQLAETSRSRILGKPFGSSKSKN